MIFRYFAGTGAIVLNAPVLAHLFVAYLRYGGLFNSGMVGLQGSRIAQI